MALKKKALLEEFCERWARVYLKHKDVIHAFIHYSHFICEILELLPCMNLHQLCTAFKVETMKTQKMYLEMFGTWKHTYSNGIRVWKEHKKLQVRNNRKNALPTGSEIGCMNHSFSLFVTSGHVSSVISRLCLTISFFLSALNSTW